MQSLPTDLAIKLRERKPATTKEAAEITDDYDLAHGGEELIRSKPPHAPTPQFQLEVEVEGTQRLPPKQSTPTKKGARLGYTLLSKTNYKGHLQCYNCLKWGHIAAFSPNKKTSGEKAVNKQQSVTGRHQVDSRGQLQPCEAGYSQWQARECDGGQHYFIFPCRWVVIIRFSSKIRSHILIKKAWLVNKRRLLYERVRQDWRV